MDTERRLITLPDGRDIDLLLAGPPDGLPLVMHEGTPHGLVLYPPTVQTAQDRHLRSILVARPGYEPPCYPDDAWRPPPSPAPRRSTRRAGLHRGHGPGERRGVRGRGARPGRADRVPRPRVGRFRRLTGPGVAAGLGGLVADADRAVLTGAYAEHLAAGVRTSLNGGLAGWRDDDLAFVTDWGFSLSGEQKIPAAIWQGDQDRMVPFAHGQWLAANIPGARAHLLPGEGHLTMTVSALGRVLDDLLDLAGLS